MNEEISRIRNRLYAGEMDITEIYEIAEKYSQDVKGVILIAEVCTYFKRQKLAIQTLNDYKKNHPDISIKEMKTINAALEIARSKQKIADSIKWSKTYGQNSKNINERL